jgi:hypothetical protein
MTTTTAVRKLPLQTLSPTASFAGAATSSLQVPTGHIFRSTSKAFINHPDIPRAAEVVVFADKDLPIYNLISVPQLCMAGMTATFDDSGATLTLCLNMHGFRQ